MKNPKHPCIRGYKCGYLVETVEPKALCTYLTQGPDTEVDLSVIPKWECVFYPSKKFVHVDEEPQS